MERIYVVLQALRESKKKEKGKKEGKDKRNPIDTVKNKDNLIISSPSYRDKTSEEERTDGQNNVDENQERDEEEETV